MARCLSVCPSVPSYDAIVAPSDSVICTGASDGHIRSDYTD